MQNPSAHGGRPPFAVTTSRTAPQEVTLHLDGELDLATQSLLSDEIRLILSAPETLHVTIDAARLEFMDSTGLAVLLALSEAIGLRDGTVTVTSPRPVVRRVITISGVDDRLRLR